MRAVTAALLAALLTVLSLIAYDLHRVAGVLAPAPAAAERTIVPTTARAETHEERVRRLERELRESRAEAEATLEASRRLDKSRR